MFTSSSANTKHQLDQEALIAIFDLYAPALYKYAFRLCRDPLEADQIVGDTFSQFVERLSIGEGPKTNLRAYLYQITYHIAVNYARERNRTMPLDDDLYQQSQVPVPLQTEIQILLGELASALKDELTDEQRQVILLRFQENMSLRETAAIMGKQIDAVKALQKRGIKKLQQVLGNQI